VCYLETRAVKRPYRSASYNDRIVKSEQSTQTPAKRITPANKYCDQIQDGPEIIACY